MDFRDVRRLAIIALFSDDFLMQKLVLKGGNALDIVHGVGNRSSLDIDLSMPDDFTNLEDVKSRLECALANRFDAVGLQLFDLKFTPQPTNATGQRWGGYRVEFKLIEKKKFKNYGSDLSKIRREAVVIGAGDKRVFSIDISKYEYCEPEAKTEAYIDEYMVYAYTLPMIAIEKLRAICQQMPDYQLRAHPSPRARDFYDIHAVVTTRRVDLFSAESLKLLEQVFAVKDVPIALLAKVGLYKSSHESDWPSVRNSLRTEPGEFAVYFDFVAELAEKLKAHWNV